MNQIFSMQRLVWLMRADLVARYRTVLIIMGTLTVLVLAHGMLTANSQNPGQSIYGLWFFGMLFVWAPVAASVSFRELHDKARNESFLLLPASALEKTLTRLLIVTLLLGAFIVALLYLLGWLNVLLNLVIFGQSVPRFSLGDYSQPSLWLSALSLQSTYFLGAAWFRKSHFVKTSFAMTLISVAVGFLGGGLFWLFFSDYFPGSFFAGGFTLDHGAFYEANRGLFRFLERVGPILYFAVLPVFCWWVAWLRVKEAQVNHGV